MALSPFQAISKLTVNSTISQDRSLGRKVEEDLNLASFGERLLSWAESHTDAQSTTTSTAPVGLEPPRTGENHALQDYQMQLMILEQQNKKRLQIARAEQGKIIPRQENTTGNKEVMEVPAQGPNLKAPRVFTSTPPTVGKAQDNAHAQQDTQTRETEQVADRLDSSPLKVAAQGDGKARKRRRVSIGDSQDDFLSKSVDCTIVVRNLSSLISVPTELTSNPRAMILQVFAKHKISLNNNIQKSLRKRLIDYFQLPHKVLHVPRYMA